MIKLYSGTPGSGKSLHLARDLADAYQTNRPIITNFNLNIEKLNKTRIIKRKNTFGYNLIPNKDLTPQRLYKYSQFVFDDCHAKYKEGYILLVIDECQLLFNSREWQKSGRADWLEFYTQHRKLGYDIILVAQFDRMIDRQIRSLIELEYEHRKVSSFGNFGKFCPFSKSIFCVVEKYYPLNERLNASFFVKQKKYYSIYDTNFMFNSI